MHYDRLIGRIRLKVGSDGFLNHDYGHGCELLIRNGWNDNCKFICNYLSIDELHDLRHLIDRVMAKASSGGKP